VTVTHSRTVDLPSFTRSADILVAAIGKPGFITGDMIKPGAVVIDVGTTRIDDPSKKAGWRLSGDVDFASAEPMAGAITPVPGGVGPMTIAGLLANTLLARKAGIAAQTA
jgi:methylenetetrahydrofolate dehydrogenase (NADP+)/methenyltetrahydrofolate cyclohydrolase